jgi:Smg protein
MKQSVLDVLMYLFDSHLDEEGDPVLNQDAIRVSLLEAGFEDAKVTRAFDWLEGLALLRDQRDLCEPSAGRATRIFSSEEIERLDADGRGFLLFLEQAELLGAHERELIMDRVMALQDEEMDLDQLKWVVLMVLLNLPGRESSAAWMEDLVMDDALALVH